MDKYISAHFNLHRAEERAFNIIELRGDIVRKKISNPVKGTQEIFFYRNIPESIEDYFPRIEKVRRTPVGVSYDMELLKAFDVSVWYLWGELNPANFKKMLSQILGYFHKLPQITVSKQAWTKSCENLIVRKLNRRWKAYVKHAAFQQLDAYFKFTHGFDINSFKNEIAADLTERLRSCSDRRLFFSHGDLCFSNILMSSDFTLKFIDPKGADTKEDLFLSLYYDLAKLSHSVNGNYDGILRGQNVAFVRQQRIFAEWVLNMGLDLKLIRLIESSLFLSLLPLHLNRSDVHHLFIDSAIRAYQASK